jgi:hypothetical protein
MHQSFSLFFESIQSLEEFKKNLLGAFRIVFDLDSEDIDNHSLHTPYSKKIGLRSFKIEYDYRCPSNANNAVSVYFPLQYKAKVYIVDAMIYEWNEMPTVEDFNKCARGIDLKNSFLLKKPINTDSIFTANGDVKTLDVDDPEDEIILGSLEVQYPAEKPFTPSEKYDQFLIRDSNMMNLAKRVKEIIDGKDRDKKAKPSPIPSSPNKKSPVLVGV